VRESIFDLLGPGPPGRRVLDLFSGTGALGLEALSRGAERAVLVERERRALGLIAENARRCRLEARVELVPADVLDFLSGRPPSEPFELVLLDPPYRLGLAGRALGLLVRPGWLAPGARVVAETERDLEPDLPDELPGAALTRLRRRAYGEALVHLFAGPGDRERAGSMVDSPAPGA
jgi:16S rRNA (guanine966-N2)-methyltransferase